MKRKNLSRLSTGAPVISFFFLILLLSCGKTGPAGPQGNANVVEDTFTITSSQWLWNSQYNFETSPGGSTEYFTRYYDAAFPSATQDILNTGMVLVYFTPNPINNNQWAPLPYQFTGFGGGFDYNIVYETKVGSVRLHYFFVSRSTSATIPTLSTYNMATYKFKLVAVSGKIVSGMKKAHIDPNDYNAVSHFVGF